MALGSSMFIKKIIVRGEGKVDACLIFTKGLNVVSGASDTGKSYVVQCLKFIFGASKTPKNIQESFGYDRLEVVFEDGNGEQFKLQRNLIEKSDIILIEEKSGQPDVVTSLKAKHAKGLKNLSNNFLNRFNLSDKLLLKGKEKLNTQSLSIRTLERIFIVDEARIVAEYSPLGTGNPQEITLEKSFLKVLLTGVDEGKVKEVKNISIEKQSLKGKIDQLESLINKLYPKDDDLEHSLEEIKIELSELELEEDAVTENINSILSYNKETLFCRKNISNKIKSYFHQISESKTLHERFTLLKAKYQSDKERLDAIYESTRYFEKYEKVACPTCEQNFISPPSEEEASNIINATQAEIKKINRQLQELEITLNDLSNNIKIDNEKVKSEEIELDKIDLVIDADIKQKINELNAVKQSINKKRNVLLEAKFKFDYRNKALTELGSLKLDYSSKQDSYEMDSFESELNSLTKEIENILKRWGYPQCEPTTFDLNVRDIVIGSKPRGDFGKGYRAIGFAAYVIGLMTTLSKDSRHPNFVVLDSPLTTYKKADNDVETSEESIASDLIYSFYRDLCDSYNDKQIIIFDNQEPDVDLQERMNYIHFSKSNDVDRYGFFPST